MHTEQTITPNQQFYLCVELLDMTLRKCSWSALVKMSKVSKFLREMVFSMIRTRVRKMVSKYIPSQDIDRFFEIMAETKSVIAGSLVRCIMTVDDRGMFDRHYPLQLNIVVPFLQKVDPSDGGTDGYQQWKRFLLGRKYDNECGGGDGIAPFHLSATASMWTLHKCENYKSLRISLIQSRTASALVPVLQSCHSSNFFALSVSRFYSIYPNLFAAKVNVNMKERMPTLKCAFDSFNLGLTTFRSTDNWDVFPKGVCGEACPAKWRRIEGLRGVGVFRWGGILGDTDNGSTVSKSDGFEVGDEMWRVHGECTNQRCPALYSCNNISRALF